MQLSKLLATTTGSAGNGGRTADGVPQPDTSAATAAPPAWHTLTLASTLSPCAMCSGTTVLHRIPRVVIGENTTFLGREDWMQAAGIEVVNLNDARCVQMMREFIAARPELWDEDIGIPPGKA